MLFSGVNITRSITKMERSLTWHSFNSGIEIPESTGKVLALIFLGSSFDEGVLRYSGGMFTCFTLCFPGLIECLWPINKCCSCA